MPPRPRVLVLATAYRAGPWAVRSLAAAGYDVVGAHEAGRVNGARSAACPRPRRYPSPVARPDDFLQAVRDLCAREAIDVVLPAAEDVTRVLAQRRPDLGDAVVACPDAAAYAAVCDKGRLAATAARAGVAHPATVVVGPDGPRGPWPPLPSIVKPRISGEDLGAAAPACMAHDEDGRREAVAGLLGAGLEAIVQEWVAGGRWTCQSVREPAGRLDFVASRIECDHPRGAGVGSVMHTTADPPPVLRERVAALLDLIGYRGPSTIGFIERDGEPLVHDVNLRLGSSVGLVMRSGLDMPRRAVEVAMGVPAPPQPPVRPTTYVRVDGEASALAAALSGRGDGEPARAIAWRLLRAAAGPGAMLDPFPLDPFWAGHLVGSRLLVSARAARRGLAGRGTPVRPAPAR
jgi:carbamoyl-phosphate synthase large subunit